MLHFRQRKVFGSHGWGPSRRKSVRLPETQRAPMLFLLLGTMNSHKPKLRNKDTETKSKAETNFGAYGTWGQAGCDPGGCHPMGFQTNILPPTSWRQVKTSFSKEALKRRLSINLSVVRGFSAAINHSGSQTGLPWRCP